MLLNPSSIDNFIRLLQKIKNAGLNAHLVVAGADHGIAKEGVSKYQYGETLSILKFSASLHSPVSILSNATGVTKSFINVGCAYKRASSMIIDKYHVTAGCENIIERDAMTGEVLQKIFSHADKFISQVKEKCICIGEVGVGNTFSSAILTILMTDTNPDLIVGSGSGITESNKIKKIQLVKKCLQRYKKDYKNDNNPYKLLQSLGGIEIAWNVGVILKAAHYGKIIFIDGFISTVSAVIAYLIDNSIHKNLIATHFSREPGHRHLLNLIDLKPFLDFDLALGQGFGAVLGFSFLRSNSMIFLK